MLFFSFACFLVTVFAVENPVDFVNTQGGSQSAYDLSRGSTLPLVARPWGFNSWAPYTTGDTDSWWFNPTDRRFFGMRCTHQPSPWIGDYAHFVVKATIPQSTSQGNDYSSYTPTTSTFSPHLFKTNFTAFETGTEDTVFEFTATQHGAMMRTSFPSYVSDFLDSAFNQNRRISISLPGATDTSSVSSSLLDTVTISGKTSAASGGVPIGFAFYYVLAIYTGENGNTPITSYLDSYSTNTWAWIDLDASLPENELVTVRIGTSFISLDQAILNLKAEVGSSVSFDSVVQAGRDEWNTLLSRVNVEELSPDYSSEEAQNIYTTFYSCLYRASLFPRQLSEQDSNGQLVHWSPFDNKVHAGPYTTDSGFWDAYISVYPLMTLVNKPQLGVTIQGWVNAYVEGGWLPTWSSPGWRGSMVGTMGDVTLADAIVKSIPGFDVELAYEAIRKDAFNIQTNSAVGRACLTEYESLGYVTRNCASESVSRTLNYLQSDYAIAQAAQFLGKNSDAEILSKRASNFSKLFDKAHLFFRSADSSNNFLSTFDQFAWGGDYTEGGPWQYKFYLPYNPSGLADLYSSSGSDVCEQLQTAQTMKGAVHVGGYSSFIHEQTEMTDIWGQYAHNNQPVHHMLYMFGAVDTKGYSGPCAAKGQFWLRKTMSQLYKPTNDMYPGDEDNGEMSAWYILSSLGLYNLSPGDQDFVFGSPLFQKVVVNMDNEGGEMLTIIANNNSKENVYVQAIYWNGELLTETNSIAFSKLRQGGELKFEMGPSPASTNNLKSNFKT